MDTAIDPWMAADAQLARRSSLGLDEPSLLAFLGSCELISLGCQCAVSCALHTLGLKKYSYPFDWVRSDIRGVIHCLGASFEDFLTFTDTKKEDTSTGTCTVFTGSRWGGSFWHHAINDHGIQSDMKRRAERFLGLCEVPPSTLRIFVCAVNSTRDLDDALHLRDALRRTLPETPFKILFLIDRQKQAGAMRLAGVDGSDILFYQIDFHANKLSDVAHILYYAEPYAEAIAFAIKCWASNQEALATVTTLPSLADITDACDQWHGGDPASALFQPLHFKGKRMTVGNARSRLPTLVAERVGRFKLPVDFVGGKVRTSAFGNPIIIGLPQEAVAGMTVEICLAEGVVKAKLLASIGTVSTASHTDLSSTIRQGATPSPAA